MKDSYFANTKQQRLDQHLFAVGFLARGIVKRQVPNHENLAKSAFLSGIWHDVGKIDRVVPVLSKDSLRFVDAINLGHFLVIVWNGGIIRMDGVVYAGVAMTVRPGSDAHLLEKLIGGHERGDNLHGHRLGRVLGGLALLPDPDRGADGAFVGDHWVAGIGLVFDQHLPIAAMHEPERRSRDLQLTLG